MKYIFTALLTAGVLVGTASAQYTFGEFDTDGDGQVGSGEFGEVYENDLYSTFDVDGDDVIDQNEFGTGLYNTFDADDDGVLTESEYTTGVETFYGGDYSLAYSDFDTDGDGEVTEEEFVEAYDSEGLFDTFDTDGNDEIVDEEFSEGLFGLVDENDDGFFHRRRIHQHAHSLRRRPGERQ